jgi:hypothetical protein
MKAIVAQDALIHWPDHNKPFTIETDASDYQLGAVIMQDGNPVAYYSRKLNTSQRNYSTIEKEMLSIVETLKHYHSMLLGADISVFTDHKNLAYALTQFQTQRVMRWRLALEEFNPKISFKHGAENVIADALSRVPTKSEFPWKGESPAGCSGCLGVPYVDEEHTASSYASLLNDNSLVDCFAVLDEYSLMVGLAETLGLEEDLQLLAPCFDEAGRYPLDYATVKYYQDHDNDLQQALLRSPHLEMRDVAFNISLVVHIDDADEDEWRIVIPDSMLDRMI